MEIKSLSFFYERRRKIEVREFENRLFVMMEEMEHVMDTVNDVFDKTIKAAVMVFMMLMALIMSIELMSFRICCSLPFEVKCIITISIVIVSYKIFNKLSKNFPIFR